MFQLSEIPYAVILLVVFVILTLLIDSIQRYCLQTNNLQQFTILCFDTIFSISKSSYLHDSIPKPSWICCPTKPPIKSKKHKPHKDPLTSAIIVSNCIDILRSIFSFLIILCSSYIITTYFFLFLQWQTKTNVTISNDFKIFSSPIEPSSTTKKIEEVKKLKISDAELLKKPRYIESKYSCLTGIVSPLDGRNEIYSLGKAGLLTKDSQLNDDIIHGHTVWINEFMAVGHMMYDVYILNILATKPVDRIVLQRAPCATDNLCRGIGTWLSWYEGYYGAMIEAFRPGIPVYVRWNRDEEVVYPLLINHGKSTDIGTNSNISHKSIRLDLIQCFEYVYTRNCNQCFYRSVKYDIIQRFQSTAYAIANDRLGLGNITSNYSILVNDTQLTIAERLQRQPLSTSYAKDGPIVITLSYRGGLSNRQIINIEVLIDYLKRYYSSPGYHLNFFYSSNTSVPYEEQIALVARSHIVICEHGAFQSNMIYMRKNSLLIDLRGKYVTEEYKNYEELGRLVRILHKSIITTGLTEHRLYGFYIEDHECEEIRKVIDNYVKTKPFLSTATTNHRSYSFSWLKGSGKRR